MFTRRLYVLSGHHAVKAKNLLEWSIFMEKGDRRVALDEIEDFSVSTVFLGSDHSRSSDSDGENNADPMLFETAVFAGDGVVNVIRRYFTWAEAEAGHKEACDTLRTTNLKAQGAMQQAIERIKESSARHP